MADDHVILRQGTIALLRKEPDLAIVGEASTGQEAIELARTLLPDVVIMDIRLPLLSGVESTRVICSELPGVKVVVLTAHNDDQYVYSAIEAGASGYLLKTAPVIDLIKAIRQVHQGEACLDPVIAAKLLRRMSRLGHRDHQTVGAPGLEALTHREHEVLRSLAEGLSNKAIANHLSISERTVQAHLTNIYGKLQVASRTEAVMAGIRLGWLLVEPQS